MGDLILMSRANATVRTAPAAGESAAILFFTGVRYYRMPDAVASAPATPVRRRPRAKKISEAPRLDCQA